MVVMAWQREQGQRGFDVATSRAKRGAGNGAKAAAGAGLLRGCKHGGRRCGSAARAARGKTPTSGRHVYASTCRPAVTMMTPMKMGERWMPSNTFSSSLMRRELTSFRICSQMKLWRQQREGRRRHGAMGTDRGQSAVRGCRPRARTGDSGTCGRCVRRKVVCGLALQRPPQCARVAGSRARKQQCSNSHSNVATVTKKGPKQPRGRRTC